MGENICLFLQKHSCRTDTSVWFPFLTRFLLLIQLIVEQSLEQDKSVIKLVLLCTIIFCIFNSASLLIKENYPCFCRLIFSKTNNDSCQFPDKSDFRETKESEAFVGFLPAFILFILIWILFFVCS